MGLKKRKEERRKKIKNEIYAGLCDIGLNVQMVKEENIPNVLQGEVSKA